MMLAMQRSCCCAGSCHGNAPDSAIVLALFTLSRWVLSPGPPPCNGELGEPTNISRKKWPMLTQAPCPLIACSRSCRPWLLARVCQDCPINSQHPFSHHVPSLCLCLCLCLSVCLSFPLNVVWIVDVESCGSGCETVVHDNSMSRVDYSLTKF